MIYIHLLAAILATWRITELFTQDRITDRLRKRFPTYLWQCPRCMSVWAGVWATAMFALGPLTHITIRGFHVEWLSSLLGLWPFAFAWLYLVRIEQVYSKRITKEGRRLVVEAQGPNWTLSRNDFNPQESREIITNLLVAMSKVQQPFVAAPVVQVPSPIKAPEQVPLVNGKDKTSA